MAIKNRHLNKLQSGYLFPEINKRRQQFLKHNPTARLISLGIGDTSEPLHPIITETMAKETLAFSSMEGYKGYPSYQGDDRLREAISREIYHGKVPSKDIFISDGSKCDVGRLQLLFGSDAITAVQNPSYPVYVDTSVILGRTGTFSEISKGYSGLVYLDCCPENGFFPDLNGLNQHCDVIYFCSPNNPTGVASTREQLLELVRFAKNNRSIIIFDAAYAAYIRDPELPKSIYEIPGSEEVAIEIGSFSKMCGFTGIRLAWSVVPETLRYEDGSSIQNEWARIQSTFFNGVSHLSQRGGVAALESSNRHIIEETIDYYLENAALLKNVFENYGLQVFGGVNAPFLWVKFPFESSWEAFDSLLNHAEMISTPGVGFGEVGEGFLRFSAFGSRNSILEAVSRFERYFEEVLCIGGAKMV